MTSGWLLLLMVLVASSQAASDEVIQVLLTEIEKDMEGSRTSSSKYLKGFSNHKKRQRLICLNNTRLCLKNQQLRLCPNNN